MRSAEFYKRIMNMSTENRNIKIKIVIIEKHAIIKKYEKF